MRTPGLLVISFGGPHKSEDIRPFLRSVLAGRPVPEERFESVVHHYELLGGRSPITALTEAQARALEAELSRRGRALSIRIGMRHWTPWLREALAGFMREGHEEVIGLIMAAIYRALLDEIERDGFHVLTRKTSLTPLRKFWIAWKTWIAA